MSDLQSIRQTIRKMHLAAEEAAIQKLIGEHAPSLEVREQINERANAFVHTIREDNNPGLMEVFLAEYGLSTDEGIALMCLAEALLRVPDGQTIDDLIEDKIAPSSWGKHLGQSSSSLVNASTWALMLTGRVLDDNSASGFAGILKGTIKRLGEPVIRTAAKRAMKELGNQFVLGETIDEAVARSAAQQEKGFTFSYDMLGEAALTADDAQAFYDSYEASIRLLSKHATSKNSRENPGISIKLSALHPRFEVSQKARVMRELTARTLNLALLARSANMGLNIDAEEADRLDLSLDVIEAVLRDQRLAGWDGFGVVVQAYGQRASGVIDWLYALGEELDHKIMVRLVKGAYWDSEIKRAQVEGIAGFPVFTRKASTDASYICCAAKLLGMTDYIYPQFATHNAHSVAAILEMAKGDAPFEFQRLHGMGESLHRHVMNESNGRCRIYAPVGAHRDLLAYLVRRLLENGANSSFVNQIVDLTVSADVIASDPFASLQEMETKLAIPFSRDLYAPSRENSQGFDLNSETDLDIIDAARSRFMKTQWRAAPLMADHFDGTVPQDIQNPADPSDLVGDVVEATEADVERAIASARPWNEDGTTAKARALVLTLASRLYEEHFGELFAVLTREAGKTPEDAIAELREAVDFLRYYATKIESAKAPHGLITCISPWNFPLAIFTGQIAAALAAGNSVLAKPAEQTPLVAAIAVKLLHEAGVPRDALQLLPGAGVSVGAKLTTNPRIDGVCFTGSTATARIINRSMADFMNPGAPLIAETGGINAMIVDSTALPQQVITDIVTSSFRSAGQRCSALRLLYIQEDVADEFLTMLYGAMDELVVGDPWSFASDLGPLISSDAQRDINTYVTRAEKDARLMKQIRVPDAGNFVGPCVISVNSIKDLEREIFGPVLHVARFKSEDIDQIIEDINTSGYGLTFGLHTRIDSRVEHLSTRLNVGNMYINRNQIGAIVGSQPFGGEGMSGTGPKAGGPHYVARFYDEKRVSLGKIASPVTSIEASAGEVGQALARLKSRDRVPLTTSDLPGPTGESNRLMTYPRGTVLCLGPTMADAQKQAESAMNVGCSALIVAPGARGENAIDGFLARTTLRDLKGIDVVIAWSDEADLRKIRQALARRDGPLIPLVTSTDIEQRCVLERHICIDTTASGGNASLLERDAIR